MATKKISQLPLATGVTGVDVVPIVQGGVTRRATIASIAAVGPTGPAGATGAAGQSIVGPTGPQGESIVGPTGPAGQAGQSVVGPTGPAGAGEAYVQANAPASASAGATWLDTDNGRYYVRFGSVWIETGFQPQA